MEKSVVDICLSMDEISALNVLSATTIYGISLENIDLQKN